MAAFIVAFAVLCELGAVFYLMRLVVRNPRSLWPLKKNLPGLKNLYLLLSAIYLIWLVYRRVFATEPPCFPLFCPVEELHSQAEDIWLFWLFVASQAILGFIVLVLSLMDFRPYPLPPCRQSPTLQHSFKETDGGRCLWCRQTEKAVKEAGQPDTPR